MKQITKDRIFALVIIVMLLAGSLLVRIKDGKDAELKHFPYSLSRFKGY